MRYTLSFKVHLLDQVKSLEDEGKIHPSPRVVVSGRYKLNETHIFKWKRQETKLREAITSNAKEGSKYYGVRMLRYSKEVRRHCLGGGRSAIFPLAEIETYDELCFYRREQGARTGPPFLGAMMRRMGVQGHHWERNEVNVCRRSHVSFGRSGKGSA